VNPVQQILIFAVRVYRWTLSPALGFVFGPGAGCRFTPTCSQYALDALRSHGALGGSWLAAKRVCRCHPWGTCGHDPVPSAKRELRSAKVGLESCAARN
jgi:putative membrane protein insertion efficiency factor